MSKLRQRTRHMLYAALSGAAVMGVVFAGYAIFSSVQHHAREARLKADYRAQIAKIEQARSEEEKQMPSSWVLARDIAAGEAITTKDLVQVKLPLGAAPVNLIQNGGEKDVKIAKIELKKGTALTDAMIYDKEPLAADLRNRELQVVALPSNLVEHEVIDVRIQFPTGQDYIVLPKKTIDKLASPSIWITLNEQEILSFSSAMVDAYMHDAKLYAVTYVEPQMQDKAIPTYPVNTEVLKLIASNPNIVKKAEQKLSEALRTSLEKDLAKSTSDGRQRQAQSFADSQSSLSYLNENAYPASSAPVSQPEPMFGDLKQAGTATSAAANDQQDQLPPLANESQAADSFSLGGVQDNRLLEQNARNSAPDADGTGIAGPP
ncbi:SAF domain-containing protein [Paenibacillus chibensis]|uniref:SAF domain-containing protein n=1 Tax=Paenibacillus chibensis TaxID=59846 RepID=UPI0013E31C44|nr:SAF domain-containing protein [Paenibacillus chibensis]MEC0371509.1 SAF domain-containing protein [Paenibacillus chibensis]